MSGAVSGQYGSLMVGSSELIEVTNWKLDRSAAEHAYGSSSTAGYKARVAGTKDANGSFSTKYDPTDPIEDHIDAGDLVTLKLYLTATVFWTVPAMIISLSTEVDLDEGAIIGYEVNWGLNGAWTAPS